MLKSPPFPYPTVLTVPFRDSSARVYFTPQTTPGPGLSPPILSSIEISRVEVDSQEIPESTITHEEYSSLTKEILHDLRCIEYAESQLPVPRYWCGSW